ncbi:NUDIX hydrolase [Candidatus Woesearchaeota archaeon]|nr:NUDIX hydrolase [Candidatus Woesearchaeota archaeon]
MSRKNTFDSKKITLELYKKFVSLMPICCVDIVFKSGKKVYLFKRAYEPAKNEWWVVGGRVLKGEKLGNAARRKIKEEIGVDAKIESVIGVYETFLKANRFDTKDKSGIHSISVCFLAEPKKKNFRLKLNEEYTGWKTIEKIDKNLHPYIQSVLRDSGAIK